MSRFEKALARLRSRPKDFTWKELQSVMAHFGYQERSGRGSRRKFVHTVRKVSVSLHEPHPSPQMKTYAVDIIIEHLEAEGLL
jgi:hypothetical protein